MSKTGAHVLGKLPPLAPLAKLPPPKFHTFLWYDGSVRQWAYRARSTPFTPQPCFLASQNLVTEYAPFANMLMAIWPAKFSLNNFVLNHYTSMESFKSIVKYRTIRASHYKFMNDVDEIATAWKVLRHRIYWNTRHAESMDYEVFNEIENVLSRAIDLFICSFSSSPSVLSQWRAYAPHDGVSFALSTELFKHAGCHGHNYTLKAVEYDPHKQIAMLEPLAQELADCLLRRATRSEIVGCAVGLKEKYHSIAPFIKNTFFFEEREIRLITNGDGFNKFTKDDGSSFIEFNLEDLFASSTIDECIFGRVILGPPGDFMRRADDLINYFIEQKIRWGVIEDYGIPLKG